MVKTRVNGRMEVLSVKISDEALKLNDREMLEDLVRAAVNQALEKTRLAVSEETNKMAGSLGFKEAMAKAGPVLLEPISLLEVTVPMAYQGDVMGDLNARRGRVQGTDQGNDGEQIVVAKVPTSELLRYAIDLRSLTGGRGRFTSQHDHYDLLPQNLWDKVRRDQGS